MTRFGLDGESVRKASIKMNITPQEVAESYIRTCYGCPAEQAKEVVEYFTF